MKIYFAAPLFDDMEKERNLALTAALEAEGFEVFLPQRDAGEFAIHMHEDTNLDRARHDIFVKDVSAIDTCDVIVACIDGRVPDEGTVFEMGYGYAQNKPVIKYKTDERSFINGFDNIMLDHSGVYCRNKQELVNELNRVAYLQQNNDHSISKLLVLFSGGLDSTVLLAEAMQKNIPTVALSIFYGQRHAKELSYAEYQIGKYGVEWIQADLSNAFNYNKDMCSLLSGSSQSIDQRSYGEQVAEAKENGTGNISAYVPFRNGLFLSYATSIALQLGCSHIAYGAHQDDMATDAYPDCSAQFIASMKKAVSHGTNGCVELITPFAGCNKTHIVKRGLEANADMTHTWSCYEGIDAPCGKCGTCIDRRIAFENNGIFDVI